MSVVVLMDFNNQGCMYRQPTIIMIIEMLFLKTKQKKKKKKTTTNNNISKITTTHNGVTLYNLNNMQHIFKKKSYKKNFLLNVYSIHTICVPSFFFVFNDFWLEQDSNKLTKRLLQSTESVFKRKV